MSVQIIRLNGIYGRIKRLLFFSGIVSSIAEIYRTDGILGFFSGLIPRLVGEIVLTIFLNACLFMARNLVQNSEVIKFSSIPIAVSVMMQIFVFFYSDLCVTSVTGETLKDRMHVLRLLRKDMVPTIF